MVCQGVLGWSGGDDAPGKPSGAPAGLWVELDPELLGAGARGPSQHRQGSSVLLPRASRSEPAWSHVWVFYLSRLIIGYFPALE